MKKTILYEFEAVETGKNAACNLGPIVTLQIALKQMALVISKEDLKKTNTYQLYQHLLIETQDFLFEV